MPLLIDGHNVIGSGVFSDIHLADENDEAKLVMRLRAWRGRYQDKIMVIFDHGITEGRSRTLSIGGVEVRFARNPTDADDLIRRRIRKRTPNLVVVTRDRALRSEAERHNVTVWQPEDLMERMTDALVDLPADAPLPPESAQILAELERDVDEFERLFRQGPRAADDKYWTPPATHKRAKPSIERPKKTDRHNAPPPRSEAESELDEFERLFREGSAGRDDKYWTPPMDPRHTGKSSGRSEKSDEADLNNPADGSPRRRGRAADDISEFERLFGERKQEDDKYWTPPARPPRSSNQRQIDAPSSGERPNDEDQDNNDKRRKR